MGSYFVNRKRSKIVGSELRPRLRVFRSRGNIHCQVINDASSTTVAAAYSQFIPDCKGKSGIEVAKLVGASIASKAKSVGIEAVVFDRGSFKYGGRVKALADAAREGGLLF